MTTLEYRGAAFCPDPEELRAMKERFLLFTWYRKIARTQANGIDTGRRVIRDKIKSGRIRFSDKTLEEHWRKYDTLMTKLPPTVLGHERMWAAHDTANILIAEDKRLRRVHGITSIEWEWNRPARENAINLSLNQMVGFMLTNLELLKQDTVW